MDVPNFWLAWNRSSYIVGLCIQAVLEAYDDGN